MDMFSATAIGTAVVSLVVTFVTMHALATASMDGCCTPRGGNQSDTGNTTVMIVPTGINNATCYQIAGAMRGPIFVDGASVLNCFAAFVTFSCLFYVACALIARAVVHKTKVRPHPLYSLHVPTTVALAAFISGIMATQTLELVPWDILFHLTGCGVDVVHLGSLVLCSLMLTCLSFLLNIHYLWIALDNAGLYTYTHQPSEPNLEHGGGDEPHVPKRPPYGDGSGSSGDEHDVIRPQQMYSDKHA